MCMNVLHGNGPNTIDPFESQHIPDGGTPDMNDSPAGGTSDMNMNSGENVSLVMNDLPDGGTTPDMSPPKENVALVINDPPEGQHIPDGGTESEKCDDPPPDGDMNQPDGSGANNGLVINKKNDEIDNETKRPPASPATHMKTKIKRLT